MSSSLPEQTERFAQSPVNARDMDYFRETIGTVRSAEALVGDYRLLRVALGAFGLQDDLPNRAFIQKVLADGTTAEDALSNRLADKRYKAMADAFGFGSVLPPRTTSPGFADRILDKFTRQEFERAVGEQDGDMRLALSAQRELTDLSGQQMTDTTAWLTVLGNPPLRQVFEVAFGLPSSIGTIDLDQQLDAFHRASERVLGHSDISRFSDETALEDLMQAFTIRAQVAAGPSPLTPGLAALTLLQSFS